VEAYHALLFDVRPRLTARDWIAARALRPGPGNGFGGDQPGGVWKVCAYAAGPRVLEVVMAVTLNRPLPDWVHAPGGRRTPEREARLRLSCKLLVAALATPSAEGLRALGAIAGQARTLAADAAGPPAHAASRLPACRTSYRGWGGVRGRRAPGSASARCCLKNTPARPPRRPGDPVPAHRPGGRQPDPTEGD